jgi:hypothetical protein
MPLGDLSKENGEKNFLIEGMNFLLRAQSDNEVLFLLILVGEVRPRESLYFALERVRFFTFTMEH